MEQNAAVATEQQTDRMYKIVLAFNDINDQPNILKSFIGEWLLGDEDEGIRADGGNWQAGWHWSVARTRKGALVVYINGPLPTMDVYDDFNGMKAAGDIPENVLAETAIALGLDYEIELDI